MEIITSIPFWKLKEPLHDEVALVYVFEEIE